MTNPHNQLTKLQVQPHRQTPPNNDAQVAPSVSPRHRAEMTSSGSKLATQSAITMPNHPPPHSFLLKWHRPGLPRCGTKPLEHAQVSRTMTVMRHAYLPCMTSRGDLSLSRAPGNMTWFQGLCVWPSPYINTHPIATILILSSLSLPQVQIPRSKVRLSNCKPTIHNPKTSSYNNKS